MHLTFYVALIIVANITSYNIFNNFLKFNYKLKIYIFTEQYLTSDVNIKNTLTSITDLTDNIL